MSEFRVVWGRYHHEMTRVLGLLMEEAASRIWKVAANLLNKQSRIWDKGWSSSLRGWARG